MILWMSSEWLLHERYDWAIDTTLYPRLIHFLETKLEYGFYEFFSSVYYPYTLSGLLNLYEFSEDPLVKELSMQVAQQLLQDMLKPTTDLGVYFPAAARNYPEKYKDVYGQNHSSLTYLLTGYGEVPSRASHTGAFLATSSLPVDEVINSWTPHLDTVVQVGHWYQLPVRKNEARNYIESSCTAMFGYGIFIALREGIIEGEIYEESVDRAFYGLRKHSIQKVKDRLMRLNVCNGTCIGDKYYYFNRRARYEKSFGLGMFILFGRAYLEG